MVSLGQKNKMIENMQKTIVQPHNNCFVQKPAHKRAKFSRNGTILKIGHLAQAIAYG